MTAFDKFLSTPSARRATLDRPPQLLSITNFYPRPPRGGRPVTQAHQSQRADISIHALREEGDDFGMTTMTCFSISIHALREEGDGMTLPR